MCVYTTVIFFSVQHTKVSKVSERSRRRGVVEEKHAITHENVLLRCARKTMESWSQVRIRYGKKIKQQENYYCTK